MVTCPQKLYHKLIRESMYEKFNILKVSWDNTDLTDLIAIQAEFNLDIIWLTFVCGMMMTL
jgi:hypothetical protein